MKKQSQNKPCPERSRMGQFPQSTNDNPDFIGAEAYTNNHRTGTETSDSYCVMYNKGNGKIYPELEKETPYVLVHGRVGTAHLFFGGVQSVRTPCAVHILPFSFVLFPIIRHKFFYLGFELLVADSSQTTVLIILVDDPAGKFVYFNLIDSVFTLEAEELVDPVYYAVGAAFVGDSHTRRPGEQFFGVENIIYLLITTKPIGVDSGPRGIERPAHERIVIRYRQTNGTHIVGQLSDYHCVNSAEIALECDVFENRALERRISCAFAETEQRRVYNIAAVKPGCPAVGMYFVEVVVSMPL